MSVSRNISFFLDCLELRRLFAAFSVTSNLDSGVGTLRQAILDANAAAGTDTINFAIGTGLKSIALTSGLPTISSPVIIDGSTQPGYTGTPLIELNGALAGTGTSALVITAGGTTVRGLVINRFKLDAIQLRNVGNNTIQNCFIGTSSTGGSASANAGVGVYITGSNSNVIGGATFTATAGTFNARNIISGNTSDGIFIENSTGTTIRNNHIGLALSGSSSLGNKGNGIVLGAGASGSIVGGSSSTDRNLISANSGDGIQILGTGAANNTVSGNYIGVRISGTNTSANGRNGIKIDGTSATGVTGNTIGGTTTGAGNVISGNAGDGLTIAGGASNTTVQGNFIGTNAAGTSALANGNDGVNIDGSSGNTIGGTVSGAKNLISGNVFNGIEIQDSAAINNVIQGNYIGTDVNGTNAIANRDDGVDINSAANNLVGGTASGARNIISGNLSDGIEIAVDATRFSGNAQFNVVEGNYIGTNAAGTGAVPNVDNGVRFLDTTGSTFVMHNRLGGTSVASRNIISGNRGSGVTTQGLNAVSNNVIGNYIGTNASGTSALGNGTLGTITTPSTGSGVTLLSGGNFIGGAASGEGNLISGNITNGVEISSSNNVVQGNRIGTTPDGLSPLPNQESGVLILSTLTTNAQNNTVGGSGASAGNTISGNLQNGLKVAGATSVGNVIEANRIGVGSDGITNVGNGGAGVVVLAGTGNAIRRNSIFSNNQLGIDLNGDGVTANDSLDSDSGANQLQNAPTISSVSANQILFSLNSASSTSYTIEFFASSAADPSGYGEGRTFLGSMIATTDGSGAVSSSISIASAIAPGTVVSATATDSTGNSSEFSAAVTFAQSLATVQSAGLAVASAPQQLQYVFSGSLSTGTVDSTDLVLQNLTSGSFIATSSIVASATGNTVQFGFQNLPGSVLANGNYQATLLGAGILDAGGNAIDGDSNGSAGGDHAFDFFFLNADANRDRKVNTLDFNLLAANFGVAGAFIQGDFNYDGSINSTDFGILVSNWGITLPAPAALASGSATFGPAPQLQEESVLLTELQ